MTAWSLMLLAVAVTFLIVIPAWGALKFSTHRARNVKYAEAVADVVVQKQVALVSVGHPEYSKDHRIDRHWFYVLAHIGVFGYAVCMMAGAPPTSNVAALGANTRYTMATCFLVGAAMVLVGASLGLRVGRRRIMASVHDHLTSEVLGDDISLPYKVAIAGLFAVTVSSTIYATTSFHSTTGSLGGWLTGSLAVACVLTGLLLHSRIRRFERNDATLIAAAVARLERDGNADE